MDLICAAELWGKSKVGNDGIIQLEFIRLEFISIQGDVTWFFGEFLGNGGEISNESSQSLLNGL
jgi:hypothetical protein